MTRVLEKFVIYFDDLYGGRDQVFLEEALEEDLAELDKAFKRQVGKLPKGRWQAYHFRYNK